MLLGDLWSLGAWMRRCRDHDDCGRWRLWGKVDDGWITRIHG